MNVKINTNLVPFNPCKPKLILWVTPWSTRLAKGQIVENNVPYRMAEFMKK